MESLEVAPESSNMKAEELNQTPMEPQTEPQVDVETSNKNKKKKKKKKNKRKSLENSSSLSSEMEEPQLKKSTGHEGENEEGENEEEEKANNQMKEEETAVEKSKETEEETTVWKEVTEEKTAIEKKEETVEVNEDEMSPLSLERQTSLDSIKATGTRAVGSLLSRFKVVRKKPPTNRSESVTALELINPSPVKPTVKRLEVPEEKNMDDLSMRTKRDFFAEEQSIHVSAEKEKYDTMEKQKKMEKETEEVVHTPSSSSSSNEDLVAHSNALEEVGELSEVEETKVSAKSFTIERLEESSKADKATEFENVATDVKATAADAPAVADTASPEDHLTNSSNNMEEDDVAVSAAELDAGTTVESSHLTSDVSSPLPASLKLDLEVDVKTDESQSTEEKVGIDDKKEVTHKSFEIDDHSADSEEALIEIVSPNESAQNVISSDKETEIILIKVPSTTEKTVAVEASASLKPERMSPVKALASRFEGKREQSLDSLKFRTVREFFSEERSVQVGAEKQKYETLNQQQKIKTKAEDEAKSKYNAAKSPAKESATISKRLGRDLNSSKTEIATAVEPVAAGFSTPETGASRKKLSSDGGYGSSNSPSKFSDDSSEASTPVKSIASRFEGKREQSLDSLKFRTVREFFPEERSVRVTSEKQKFEAQQQQENSLDKLKFRTVREFFPSDEKRSVHVGAEKAKFEALTKQKEEAAKTAEQIKVKHTASSPSVLKTEIHDTFAVTTETIPIPGELNNDLRVLEFDNEAVSSTKECVLSESVADNSPIEELNGAGTCDVEIAEGVNLTSTTMEDELIKENAADADTETDQLDATTDQMEKHLVSLEEVEIDIKVQPIEQEVNLETNDNAFNASLTPADGDVFSVENTTATDRHNESDAATGRTEKTLASPEEVEINVNDQPVDREVDEKMNESVVDSSLIPAEKEVNQETDDNVNHSPFICKGEVTSVENTTATDERNDELDAATGQTEKSLASPEEVEIDVNDQPVEREVDEKTDESVVDFSFTSAKTELVSKECSTVADAKANQQDITADQTESVASIKEVESDIDEQPNEQAESQDIEEEVVKDVEQKVDHEVEEQLEGEVEQEVSHEDAKSAEETPVVDKVDSDEPVVERQIDSTADVSPVGFIADASDDTTLETVFVGQESADVLEREGSTDGLVDVDLDDAVIVKPINSSFPAVVDTQDVETDRIADHNAKLEQLKKIHQDSGLAEVSLGESVVENFQVDQSQQMKLNSRPMLTTERSFVMDQHDTVEAEETVVVRERPATDGEDDFDLLDETPPSSVEKSSACSKNVPVKKAASARPVKSNQASITAPTASYMAKKAVEAKQLPKHPPQPKASRRKGTVSDTGFIKPPPAPTTVPVPMKRASITAPTASYRAKKAAEAKESHQVPAQLKQRRSNASTVPIAMKRVSITAPTASWQARNVPAPKGAPITVHEGVPATRKNRYSGVKSKVSEGFDSGSMHAVTRKTITKEEFIAAERRKSLGFAGVRSVLNAVDRRASLAGSVTINSPTEPHVRSAFARKKLESTVPRYMNYENSPGYAERSRQQYERRKRLEEENAAKSEKRQRELRMHFADKHQKAQSSSAEDVRRGLEAHEFAKMVKESEVASRKGLRSGKQRTPTTRSHHRASTTTSLSGSASRASKKSSVSSVDDKFVEPEKKKDLVPVDFNEIAEPQEKWKITEEQEVESEEQTMPVHLVNEDSALEIVAKKIDFDEASSDSREKDDLNE